MHQILAEFINETVEQYSDMIIRIAFQYTRKRADAEDIAQEVFLSLIKQSPFTSSEHLKAWIIRVTVNKCKNHLKKAKLRNATFYADTGYTLDEQHSEVLYQLEKLSPKDRVILYLFYYEGYSVKEIAGSVGKRESAVHMCLSRAREKLKNLLEDN